MNGNVKPVAGVLLSTLIILAFFTFVMNFPISEVKGATAEIVDSYAEGNFDTYLQLGASGAYPNSYSVRGQCFNVTTTSDVLLDYVQFFLRADGVGASGTLVAEIYALTGTYGTTGKPTGSPLATSEEVEFSTLSLSFELETFAFNSSNQIVLESNIRYCLALKATVVSSGLVRMGADGSGPTHSGNYFLWDGSVWDGWIGIDYIFCVYGFEIAQIDSYNEANYDTGYGLSTVHPSSDGYFSAYGQAFRPDAYYNITSAIFYLSKCNSPTANIQAQLYASTGTFGSNARPTGAALAVSNTLNSSLLTGDFACSKFDFVGENQITLSADTVYVIELVAVTEGLNATDYVVVGCDTSSPSHNGNRACYRFSSWSASSAEDVIFYVYGVYAGVAPVIAELSADPVVYANKYAYFNCTVYDGDGVTNLKSASLTLDGSVVLNWDEATNTFSVSDTNNYVDFSSGTRTVVNATAYTLSWNVKFYWNYTFTSPDITSADVSDDEDHVGSGSLADWFTFEPDLIISGVGTSPTTIYENSPIYFTGYVYYEGTSTAPEDTDGITVALELSGSQVTNSTTITALGYFELTQTDSGSVGTYSYTIYSSTDAGISVTNSTTILQVTTGGSGDSGSGNPPPVTMQLYTTRVELGDFSRGSSVPFEVTLTWTGVNSIKLVSVEVGAQTWAAPTEALPKEFYKQIGAINGTAVIPFMLDVPSDAAIGEQTLSITVHATSGTAEGFTVTPVSFSVSEKQFSPAPQPVQEIVAILLAVAVAGLIVAALRRKRQKPPQLRG